MKLSSGVLFDRRYRLIENLGSGASAKVWLALDTLANNLKVAVKIFSAGEGIDTLGIQNFQREFTFVYNIQHQNLLTPTNYAVCEGIPYLVLPYCENGSASSMLGRADENDVIKFLHDVSAALECLHSHNIIHQDIKPDNVLLDDDCNFLVTDFGISTPTAETSVSKAVVKGTKAYMGPERFETDSAPIKMNDIWSLGATAYEMLTDNPPFGDNGGMVQSLGEPIPDLPETVQPELRRLLFSCLDPEPWNRPNAETIRKKTQLFLETGSWKEKNEKRYLYISIAAAAMVFLIAGLWIWDYNRTKVYYYKDYVEYWGIPEGIGSLSGSEMKHRQKSYRFEYCQRKVRRVSLVNPEGNLTSHNDTEDMISRNTDVCLFYTDDGKVDYKTIYDQSGKLLYKMDYDEALKTVTFRLNDEYGTEMNLRANTTDLHHQGTQLFENKSRISRYLLSYDDNGLLMKLRYVGLQNIPAGDAENIYGINYKYDERGHKIEEQFVGADGMPTNNGIGLSCKKFKYDEDDNWCEVRYLNLEGGPSHDGNNCHIVRIDNDEWGNRLNEKYYTSDGELSIRTDVGVTGYNYEIDEDGHLIVQTCIGSDGKPIPCKYGFVKQKYAYDENGYIKQITFLDSDGNPASLLQEGTSISRMDLINDSKGLTIERSFYDEDGKKLTTTHGYFKETMEYDSVGNQTALAYWDEKGNPALYDGLYSKMKVENDEFGRLTAFYFLDTTGKATTNEDEVSIVRAEYNRQGRIAKLSYYDKDNKPTIGSAFYASSTWDYDEFGNEKTHLFYDADGKLTNNESGVAKIEYSYDSKTNFMILAKDYNDKGALLGARNVEYDKRGNIIKEYTVDSSGQLKKGSAVVHIDYDTNNRPVTTWWSNLKNQPVNNPGTKVAKKISKYDKRGNEIETTFWGSDGKASVDEQGTFKRERKFNELGMVIYERNLDANNKPLTGKDLNPEGKCEYDRQGNLTKLECYDGYGKPRLSSDGFFRMTAKYNNQNCQTEVAYFGLNGNLVKSRSNEYAKKQSDYNNRGLLISARYFDEKQNVFRFDSYKYNEKNRLTEQLITNAKKQQDDTFWGYSKMIISYNTSGLIPTVRTYYNKTGAKLGNQRYNEAKKEWGTLTFTNTNNSFNVMGSQWRQSIMTLAAQCPMDTGNGVILKKISVDVNTVHCVVKLVTVNIDELEDEQLENIRKMIGPITEQLRKSFGIPSTVSFILVLQDKNENRIN